jgi:hypothetical protein
MPDLEGKADIGHMAASVCVWPNSTCGHENLSAWVEMKTHFGASRATGWMKAKDELCERS